MVLKIPGGEKFMIFIFENLYFQS